MPNPLGSLLKKKRTKDKESPSSPPADNRSNTTTGSSLTQTSSNTSSKAPGSLNKLPSNDFAQEKGADLMYAQSPTQEKPQPALTQSQQQNAASLENILNKDGDAMSESSTKGNPTGQTQPAFAQSLPPSPEVIRQTGIHQMSDGTWPMARDEKGTKGKYHLQDFDFKRTLGTGSFGRVHMVQSKHNQRFYAVKVLKKQQVVKMKQVEHTNDERKMLARVKHPFLITLWGTFTDSKNLYMVMDFVEGGELFSLLRKSQVSRLEKTQIRPPDHTVISAHAIHSVSQIPSPSSTRQKSRSPLTTCTRSTLSTVT